MTVKWLFYIKTCTQVSSSFLFLTLLFYNEKMSRLLETTLKLLSSKNKLSNCQNADHKLSSCLYLSVCYLFVTFIYSSVHLADHTSAYLSIHLWHLFFLLCIMTDLPYHSRHLLISSSDGLLAFWSSTSYDPGIYTPIW